MASSHSIPSEGKSASRPISRTSACRRPKLMRSSATAPSLATSNACRSDLAYLHPSSRATAILSRVASSSPPRTDAVSLSSSQDSCRRSVSPRRTVSDHGFSNTVEEQKESIYTCKLTITCIGLASQSFRTISSYNLKHNASISASRISKISTRIQMMAVKNSEIDCFVVWAVE